MKDTKNKKPMARYANLNQQNYNMAVLYEKTQQALLALMMLNITILRIELEGANPLIEVAQSGRCKKLEGQKYATIGTGAGDRHTTMRVSIYGCTVQWHCNYETH